MRGLRCDPGREPLTSQGPNPIATPTPRFAKWVFLLAGIYGLLVLPPMYFLEERVGREAPPAVTHPEFYYGFLGVAVAWQVAFVLIGRDPVRFRPMMPAAVLEKATYGVAAWVLFAQGRVPGMILMSGLMDLALGALFVAAYLRTR